MTTDHYPKGVMVTPAVTTALRLLGGKRKYSWIAINKNKASDRPGGTSDVPSVAESVGGGAPELHFSRFSFLIDT